MCKCQSVNVFLTFIIFQNFVVVLTSLIAYLIPDVPTEVKKEIRREAYISNEIVIKTELVKAKGQSISELLLGNLASKVKSHDTDSGNGTDLRHRNEGDGARVDDVSVSNI